MLQKKRWRGGFCVRIRENLIKKTLNLYRRLPKIETVKQDNMGIIKNWLYNRAVKRKIAVMHAKAEFYKAKAAINSQKNYQKASRSRGIIGDIERVEQLKEIVAQYNDKAPILQVLENPMVQQLIAVGVKKFMGGEIKVAGDDELITLYKGLPDDIKDKVKSFALDYIGKGAVQTKLK